MFQIKKSLDHYKERIKLNRRSYLVYTVLRILVIITAVRSFFLGNYESLLLCILSLILLLLPAFFEEKFRVRIPTTIEIIIYLFIYAAEILGEVNHFYTAIPIWDTMLHTLNGFLCAAIGFSLVELLNRNSKRMHLSPLYLTLVAFCFSMTVGVLWEFFEFGADQFFGLDMQKDFIVSSIASVTLDPDNSQKVIKVSEITRTIIETASGEQTIMDGGYLDIGIIDTMKDLIVNFVGAVVFSVFGYMYVKYQDKNIASKLRLQPLTKEDIAKQNEKIRASKNPK